MNESMKNRRSIRKYQDAPVSRALLEQILQAGNLAPSAKNRQPWRFVVATGRGKAEAVAAMRRGLAREAETPLLPGSAQHRQGAAYTAQIMEQAPAVIFAINPLGRDVRAPLSPEERVYEICNAQSLGAALENMALRATELGLGSLWICDIYFAYDELKAWLGGEGEPFAAMAIGYAAEAPRPRPRRALRDIVEWRG